ncbi:EsV-1-48 [Ectocarpus siliculosus]|uniref:EsV-1-48 n=1 Tax=Ectocarpus siliculosus TaxID=2880 RepID=D8LP81_ECTSI|nr:EsV-1-48 [Ectocarpus siliculosus]|eukprot:CBN80352.1 EsV-1-48 [Ectocarpus siliculosus]
MWSSKEVLFISIATGFVFCFATIYAQNAMSRYVNHCVAEKTAANPLIGMGLVSKPSQQQRVQQNVLVSDHASVADIHSPPPGSGARWTPLST